MFIAASQLRNMSKSDGSKHRERASFAASANSANTFCCSFILVLGIIHNIIVAGVEFSETSTTSSITNNTQAAAVTGYYVSLDAPMPNVSEYQGRSVRIRCEVTGFPLPRYRWLHNGQSLLPTIDVVRTSGRYDVKTTVWGSRLKIENLRLFDSGTYTCEGYNDYGRQSTSGHLTVLPETVSSTDDLGHRDIRTSYGQSEGDIAEPSLGGSRFKSDNNDALAGGHNDDGDDFNVDDQDEDEEEDEEDALFAAFDDTVDLLDSEKAELARLATEVDNRRNHKKPTPSGSRSGSRTRQTGAVSDLNMISACHSYIGQVCTQFIHDVNAIGTVPDVFNGRQRLAETQLTATVALMATSSEFDRNKCSEYALPVLCLYTFPICKNTATMPESEANGRHPPVTGSRRRTSTKATTDRKTQSYVPNQNQRQKSFTTRNQHTQRVVHVEHLCREDCEELERTVCREPLDLVTRQTYGGKSHNAGSWSFYYVILPTSVVGPLLIGMLVAVVICLCRRHRHCASHTKYKRPDSANSVDTILKNSSLSTSSSMTVKKSVRLPLSPTAAHQPLIVGNKPNNRQAAGDMSTGGTRTQRLPGGDCYCSADEEIDDAVLWIDEMPTKRAQNAASPGFVTENYPDGAQHASPPSGVQLMRLLGAGAYGNLYIGHVTEPDLLTPHQWWSEAAAAAVSGSHRSRPAVVIAVYAKVLAPDAAVPGAREIDRLRQLDHPNIVRLVTVIGASTEPTEFHQRPTACCLLYEYNEHGIDLVQYLTTVGRLTPTYRRNNHDNLSSSTVISTDWRCLVATQVATALVYLSSRGLVHRDVAARNVIVSNPRRRRLPTFSTDDEDEDTECEENATVSSTLPTAKLSDFSLSRRPYSADYIPLTMRGDGRTEEDICRLVPLRWSAPEAVNGGRHSEATDSWSFGVLLWELYVGVGQERPHDTVDDDELLDVITTAGRPPSLRSVNDGKSAEVNILPSFVRDLIVDCGDVVPAHRPRFLEIVDRLQQVTNKPPCSTPSHSNGTSPDGGSTAHLLQTPSSSSTLPRSAQANARVTTAPTSTTPNSPTAVVRSGNGDGAGTHQPQLAQRTVATGGNGWPAPPPAAWWAASPTPSVRRLTFGTSTPPAISGLVTTSTSSSSFPHQLQHPHHQHQQQQQLQQLQQHQPHPKYYQLQQPTRMHDVVL